MGEQRTVSGVGVSVLWLCFCETHRHMEEEVVFLPFLILVQPVTGSKWNSEYYMIVTRMEKF